VLRHRDHPRRAAHTLLCLQLRRLPRTATPTTLGRPRRQRRPQRHQTDPLARTHRPRITNHARLRRHAVNPVRSSQPGKRLA
jgi:hypothetical protein